MIALTLGQIADIVGGRLYDAEADVVVSGPVEFDTRRDLAGGLFVAFAGEHADGHMFVPDALRLGARACLVTRPVPGPRIEVSDALAALTELARFVAARLPATIIGVTGSSGKTSTKDLLAQVLAHAGPTIAPPGSFNNELGHPYTVLRADERTRFLVLELSARGIGHIRHLTRIAPPRMGAVLNVGSAHLGEFGSVAAIAQAKGELVEALPVDGVAVLNADDELVRAMASRTQARVVNFGATADAGSAQVRATAVRLGPLGRPSFELRTPGGRADVDLGLTGVHQVSNALATAAIALECGMGTAAIAEALSQARPLSRWRMEVTDRSDGVMVLNDAYNANPDSMRAALRTLVAVAAARADSGGRGFAVLGPMAELGAASEAEHEQLGRFAANLGIARIVAVGAAARAIQRGAELAWSEAGSEGSATWVPGSDAAIALLRSELRPPDVVLVKASRAASLERVGAAIADDAGSVAGPADRPRPADGFGDGPANGDGTGGAPA